MSEYDRSGETRADQMVEAALRSDPLASPPPTLRAAVMQEIARSAPAQPALRPAWINYLLGSFASTLILLVIVAGGVLPPQFDLYLRLELAAWVQGLELRALELQALFFTLPPVQPALLQGLAGLALVSLAVAAGLALLLVQDRFSAAQESQPGG